MDYQQIIYQKYTCQGCKKKIGDDNNYIVCDNCSISNLCVCYDCESEYIEEHNKYIKEFGKDEDYYNQDWLFFVRDRECDCNNSVSDESPCICFDTCVKYCTFCAKDQIEEMLHKQFKKYVQDNGGYVSFNGDDNCREYSKENRRPRCKGWDGDSRRCDCGDRRVDLELDKKNINWYYNNVPFSKLNYAKMYESENFHPEAY